MNDGIPSLLLSNLDNQSKSAILLPTVTGKIISCQLRHAAKA